MADLGDIESPDRLVIRLDPSEPIELTDLTHSFSALARLYERHYRQDGERAPKLYIIRLESGSVLAEIAPLIPLLGHLVSTMDTSLIVADFTRRLWRGIKSFSDPGSTPLPEVPPRDDAADIREFVRPLTGKRGAELGIKHARLATRTGDRETVVEYVFDETELNRAAVNLDAALVEPALDLLPSPEEIDAFLSDRQSPILTEVMMFFVTASRTPGREQGKTADRVVIPDVSDKPFPVYFRKTISGDLKIANGKGQREPAHKQSLCGRRSRPKGRGRNQGVFGHEPASSCALRRRPVAFCGRHTRPEISI